MALGIVARRSGVAALALAALLLTAASASARTAIHHVGLRASWTRSEDGATLRVGGRIVSAADRCARGRSIDVLYRGGVETSSVGRTRSGPNAEIRATDVDLAPGTYFLLARRITYASHGQGGSRVSNVCSSVISKPHVEPGTAPSPSPSGPAFGTAGSPIHPGVVTFTDGAQCTANFVFSDGSDAYLGQAAHCAGTGAANETDGCDSGTLPTGTPVEVDGATQPGTLVYSSWETMQKLGEKDPATCAYNDLALIRIDPADVPSVDPTVPGFGGPTGVGGAEANDSVYSYGNSELRAGVSQLSPKQGIVLGVDGGGWSRTVITLTPGIPGDSGSGFMNASGQAIGILSTLEVLPLPLSNGVGDLAKELAYMRANSSFTGVALVPGLWPFNASLVGAITAR